MSSYESSLRVFKKGLVSGSEKEEVVKYVENNISTNRIRWLDVGIGSGNFTKKIISILSERGFEFELTGIDTDKVSLEKARKKFKDIKLLNKSFEEQTFDQKYDVIYFCQSIYYFKDKKKVIEKAKSLLAEGGLLIIVMWSEIDSLYQIYDKVYRTKVMELMNGEEIRDALDLEEIKSYSKTNFKNWKSKSEIKHVAKIISRLRPEAIDAIGVDDLEKEIKKRKVEDRVNSILTYKKAIDIEDFTDKRVKELLIKKLPSYKKLVPQIQGDKEALFMASWEKETEYIREQFPKNTRILELCCAAGIKSVVLAQKHLVWATDFDVDRLACVHHNKKLFKVDDRVLKIRTDLNKYDNIRAIKKGVKDLQAIIVDVDWRENLNDPIKKQNLNPFKTQPQTDRLYINLRKVFGFDIPIIFKVSPFVRVEIMRNLGHCRIEEIYMDKKFLCYYVYYSSKIKTNSRKKVYLVNK